MDLLVNCFMSFFLLMLVHECYIHKNSKVSAYNVQIAVNVFGCREFYTLFKRRRKTEQAY